MGDLTNVDSVKVWLDKTNEVHDGLLQMLIEGISARMELYMGRVISTDEYSQSVESPGYSAIVLDHGPITRVISVVDGVDSGALTAADYRIEVPRSLVRLSSGIQVPWATGTVAVSYEAGFESVPADIDLACVMQVAHEFRMTKAGNDTLGVSRVAANQDVGESYTYEMKPWIQQVEQTMKAHRVL